ncbi:GNAT family N-acetyltransferase [Pseudomonas putida]|uniref:GNAT family N-acetyltransferase n=1 Tax=Pseudomonas putida TaxID=303 RepID=UPI0009C16889|nr:GNAT family N-acetyltransferase [Pseudomonas putida]
MSTTVRFAVPEDARLLPPIESSAAQAFRVFKGLSWLADSPPIPVERHLELIKRSMCWVAIDADNRPQGFLSADLYGRDLHVHELSVRQTMQGQGIGRKLVQVVQEFVGLKGLRAVTLTTFRHVPWNAPFYSRLGFQIESEQQVDERLSTLLSEEYEHGFPAGSRCAMVWRAGEEF